MPKFSAICAAVLVVLAAPVAQAAGTTTVSGTPASLAQPIEAAIGRYYQADAPGAVVIVVQDGKTVLHRAYGLADSAAHKPLTLDASMRLGSITKQFTATAILMLAEEGRLALNDDITRFFPDYPTGGKRITVEHLLTHTSGIASYTDKPGYVTEMAKDLGVAQMIDSFKHDPLAFEPGTRFHYNNSGYFLLGAIIEKVSGKPYAAFLEERIFTPLDMRDTAYEGFERGGAPRASGHTRDKNKAYVPAEPLSMTQPYAAGALVSTAADLARWDAAITAGKLLQPASWGRAFTSYKLADGSATGYGYGWEVRPFLGTPVVAHGGGINGFATYAVRLPEHRAFVAVLSNADEGVADPAVVANRAAAILIGKPYPEFKAITLGRAVLERYAGVYQTDKSATRTFRRDGAALTVQRSGGDPVRLQAFSENGFFVPDGLDYFEFARDGQGKITGVTLVRDGEHIAHRRLDAPPRK